MNYKEARHKVLQGLKNKQRKGVPTTKAQPIGIDSITLKEAANKEEEEDEEEEEEGEGEEEEEDDDDDEDYKPPTRDLKLSDLQAAIPTMKNLTSLFDKVKDKVTGTTNTKKPRTTIPIDGWHKYLAVAEEPKKEPNANSPWMTTIDNALNKTNNYKVVPAKVLKVSNNNTRRTAKKGGNKDQPAQKKKHNKQVPQPTTRKTRRQLAQEANNPPPEEEQVHKDSDAMIEEATDKNRIPEDTKHMEVDEEEEEKKKKKRTMNILILMIMKIAATPLGEMKKLTPKKNGKNSTTREPRNKENV